MNIWQVWLFIIGNKQRAKKLLALLPMVEEAKYKVWAAGSALSELRYSVDEPAMCPTRVLFGDHESHRLYADARIRPALDAWDSGLVSRQDLEALCRYVITGRYNGPAYREHSPPRYRKAA